MGIRVVWRFPARWNVFESTSVPPILSRVVISLEVVRSAGFVRACHYAGFVPSFGDGVLDSDSVPALEQRQFRSVLIPQLFGLLTLFFASGGTVSEEGWVEGSRFRMHGELSSEPSSQKQHGGGGTVLAGLISVFQQGGFEFGPVTSQLVQQMLCSLYG